MSKITLNAKEAAEIILEATSSVFTTCFKCSWSIKVPGPVYGVEEYTCPNCKWHGHTSGWFSSPEIAKRERYTQDAQDITAGRARMKGLGPFSEAVSTKPIDCPNCDGTGLVESPFSKTMVDNDDELPTQKCLVCHGTGKISINEAVRELPKGTERCKQCGGSGVRTYNGPLKGDYSSNAGKPTHTRGCDNCDGNGFISIKKVNEAKITPEHLQSLQAAIRAIQPKVDAARAKYKEHGLSQMRFRWDVLHAAKWSDLKAAYKYLNDNNIDTALRSILGEGVEAQHPFTNTARKFGYNYSHTEKKQLPGELVSKFVFRTALGGQNSVVLRLWSYRGGHYWSINDSVVDNGNLAFGLEQRLKELSHAAFSATGYKLGDATDKALSLNNESIQNPNSSGQGHDPEFKAHPWASTVLSAGYAYSHSTPVVHLGNNRIIHHTFQMPGTEHKVTLWTDFESYTPKHFWSTTTSSASGRQITGANSTELWKHLSNKDARYGFKKIK